MKQQRLASDPTEAVLDWVARTGRIDVQVGSLYHHAAIQLVQAGYLKPLTDKPWPNCAHYTKADTNG